MAMITLRDDNCPICLSKKRVLLGKPGRVGEAFRNIPEIAEVDVVRCLECTGKYINPMMEFSEEFRKRLYGLDYFSPEGNVEDAKNVGEKVSIIEKLKRFSGDPTGKTLLDIGCGTGEFLKAGADQGFDVTGIDVESTTTDFVTAKYGFRTVTGLLVPGTFPRESFDVVILSQVIEHLQKPLEMLAVIHDILKPNGLFVMCTPNSDSFFEELHNAYGRFRYSRQKTYYLTPFLNPYHIIGFNLKSSRRILTDAGFVVEYCKLHSGLEWEDNTRRFVMRSIKVAGALMGKGMSIVTISRKPAATL